MRAYIACPSLCQGVCECSGMLSYFMIPAIRGYGPEREVFRTCRSCGEHLVEVDDAGVEEARRLGYLHSDAGDGNCTCGRVRRECWEIDETAHAAGQGQEGESNG